MHMHGSVESAASCSRWCQLRQSDIAYYQRHGHPRLIAPVPGCYFCKEDAHRDEERRLEEVRLGVR